MKFYRIYSIYNDKKYYSCYVPSAQLGLHNCQDGERCVIYPSTEQAFKAAKSMSEVTPDQYFIEEYEENRQVVMMREDSSLILHSLVKWLYDEKDYVLLAMT